MMGNIARNEMESNVSQWLMQIDEFQRKAQHLQEEEEHALSGFHKCLRAQGGEVGLEQYCHQQRSLLKEFHQIDVLLLDRAKPSTAQHQSLESAKGLERRERFAIRISNVANMVLFVAKVVASVKSGSLAIIASTLDSLLDLLSGFILWYTSYTMRRPNPYVYPIGKNRMQPVGILVFASIMATLGIQVLIESVRRFVSKEKELDLDGDNANLVIGFMVSATLVKFILLLFCRTFKNEIIRAYAKDHFFDVITNLMGLVAALLASKFYWWIDLVGAIMLAFYTIWNWSMTVLENVKCLLGMSAPPEYLQKLTYLCWNHHPEVTKINTVRAYSFGGFYFVEVDIVLDGEMELKLAHDIGEDLQNKLEHLPEIERAFVHLDHDYSHNHHHAISCC